MPCSGGGHGVVHRTQVGCGHTGHTSIDVVLHRRCVGRVAAVGGPVVNGAQRSGLRLCSGHDGRSSQPLNFCRAVGLPCSGGGHGVVHRTQVGCGHTVYVGIDIVLQRGGVGWVAAVSGPVVDLAQCGGLRGCNSSCINGRARQGLNFCRAVGLTCSGYRHSVVHRAQVGCGHTVHASIDIVLNGRGVGWVAAVGGPAVNGAQRGGLCRCGCCCHDGRRSQCLDFRRAVGLPCSGCRHGVVHRIQVGCGHTDNAGIDVVLQRGGVGWVAVVFSPVVNLSKCQRFHNRHDVGICLNLRVAQPTKTTCHSDGLRLRWRQRGQLLLAQAGHLCSRQVVHDRCGHNGQNGRRQAQELRIRQIVKPTSGRNGCGLLWRERRQLFSSHRSHLGSVQPCHDRSRYAVNGSARERQHLLWRQLRKPACSGNSGRLLAGQRTELIIGEICHLFCRKLADELRREAVDGSA